MDTVSYQEFKNNWYFTREQSGLRLGQAFINTFIKGEDNAIDYSTLWNTYQVSVAESLIDDIIDMNYWDSRSLHMVQPMYKGG